MTCALVVVGSNCGKFNVAVCELSELVPLGQYAVIPCCVGILCEHSAEGLSMCVVVPLSAIA